MKFLRFTVAPQNFSSTHSGLLARPSSTTRCSFGWNRDAAPREPGARRASPCCPRSAPQTQWGQLRALWEAQDGAAMVTTQHGTVCFGFFFRNQQTDRYRHFTVSRRSRGTALLSQLRAADVLRDLVNRHQRLEWIFNVISHSNLYLVRAF